MKIPISMKTPDCIEYAIKDAFEGTYDDNNERDIAFAEDYSEQIKKSLMKWFRYGEDVTLVYDTIEDTLFVEKI